tara:strand:+ start:457 stop:9108 length:8652 start_codon:yes stop_codon:yes gene_type:complete
MANGFDITDPTQLTASPETEANAPIPMEDLNNTQPDPNDPNVMFSEAALQRDKDFTRINNFQELGLSAADIVSIMGSDEGRSPEEAAKVISAKYEIEKRETLEANEKRQQQYEENLRQEKERQAALDDLLKKKDSSLQQDGELSDSGLDSSVSPEAVADPELRQQYKELEADERYSEYLNPYTTPKGIDSPELIRLMAANDSLAEDSNMDFLSKTLSSSLNSGNLEEAEEALRHMEISGIETPRDIDLEDPKSIEALKAFALEQENQSFENSKLHMMEIQEAYSALGIDYKLNPESDIDRASALGESADLLNKMDLTTQARQDAIAVQKIASEAFKEHPVGEWGATVGQIASTFVTNTASLLTNVPMAIYYSAIGEEGKSANYIRRNNILEQFNSEIQKQAQMKIGLSEEAANAGLTELMSSDKFSKGDVALKMGAVFTQVLPDVLLAALTMGRGTLMKQAAKEAMETSLKQGVKKFSFQYGTKAKMAAVKRFDPAYRAAMKQKLKGQVMVTGTSLFFGARGGTGTYAAIHDRKDLSFGEKLVYSTVVGVAEAGLTYLFKGAETLGAEGMRAFFAKGGKEEMKAAARESLRGISKAKNWGRAGKSMLGEYAEEGGIEVIDQGMDFLFNWAHGRDPKPIDLFAINDAGMAGLIGAGPMSTMGALSTGIYHSRLQKSIDGHLAYLDAIDEKLLVTEKGTLTYSMIEAERKRALINLAITQGKSQEQYDKLNDSEKEMVGGLNRELATIKQEIKETQDTDAKKALELEYSRKYQLKEQIEKAADKRTPVQNAARVEDKNGEQKTAEAKDVTEEKREETQNAKEATEEDVNNNIEETSDPEESTEVTDDKVMEALNKKLDAEGRTSDVVSAEEVEQTRKELEDKQEEAPAEEAVSPDLEDSSVTIEAGQDVDFGADWVGDGDGKISIPILNQVKKLKKAFGGVIDKFGIKVQVHLTPESFKKATGTESLGMYVPSTKTIHIQPRSKKSDVQEEFGHAVFRSLMSTNGELRNKVYQELANMNRAITFKDDGTIEITPWIKNFKKDNKGKVIGSSIEWTSPEAQAEVLGNPILRILIDSELAYIDKQDKPNERQEEAIMSMLTAYAKNPDQFNNPKGKGIIGRIIRMVNRAMKIGGYQGNFITSQDDFFSLASKFKQATEGVITDVETKAEDYAPPTTEQETTPPPPVAQEAPTPPPAAPTATDQRVGRGIKPTDKAADLIGKRLAFEITPGHEALQQDMGDKKIVELEVSEQPGFEWGVGFSILKSDYLGGAFKSTDNNEKIRNFVKDINKGLAIRGGAAVEGNIPQNIQSVLNSLQRNDPSSYDYGKDPKATEQFAPSKALTNQEVGPGGMNIKLVDLDAKTEGLESRGRVIFPNLDGAEVFFTQTVSRPNQSGVSTVRSVKEKSIKVNDFWHFRNLYAKFTGNGQLRERMEDMYYVKDGVKYPDLQPPPPRRDRQTREILKMDVPYMKSYQEFQGEEKQKEAGLTSQMSQQWSELTKEISELFRSSDKKLDLYTQERDFQPIEPSDVGFEDADALTKQVESLVIAKKNIQALIDSDITAEDLNELRGGPGQDINKATNPEIFNMSGLTPFSEAQDGEAFGEETLPDVEGLESRPMILKGSVSPKLLKNRGNITEIKGLKARVFGYDRTKKGSGVRALMNQIIKWGKSDATVITAHRDVEVADIVMGDLARMVRQEIEQGNYDQETGIGYIATMEALLKNESTLGNPDAFKRIVDKYGSKEAFERALNSRNKNGDLIGSSTEIRREIRIGAGKLGFDGQQLTDTTDEMNEGDVSLTENQVSQIKKILKPGKNLDKKSFKKRTLIAKKMLTKGQRREVYSEENDAAWSNVNTAEIVAYTKIPFKVDPSNPRGFTGFRIASQDGAAFSGLIIEDGTIDEKPQLKVVEELYTIPELFPGMTINIGEDVDVPMSELSAEDQMKQASTLAGISQVRGRVFAKANDITIKLTLNESTEETTTKELFGYQSRGSVIDAETDDGTFQLREKTWFQEWRGKWLRRLADKYRDVLLIQEDIEKQKGAGVKESQDFKMAEERMYGKAANDLQKLEDKTKELTSLMKELGLTQGAVSDYMYALHAKERNALIEERDGVENGSGMTDSEANSLIEEIAEGREGEFTEDWLEGGINASTQANLDKVVAIVREIQQDTRDTMVRFGLESQETIDVFESQFKYYVPLAGIAVDETDSANTKYPTGGAGMSVQGDTYKKAKGRKSQAANLLAQVIAQNASVHISGRTNEALQSLHELVSENPNSKVWKIIDEASYGDAHVVPVRINGEQKYIRFADSSYAETLKGMSVPRTSALVKMLRAPANWLRRSFTTLNPEFVISNFSRDIQSAIFNAMAEADIEGGALLGTNAVKDMMKMVGPSLKTLVKGVAGKSGDPMIEKYYADFQEDGGKTGWAYAKPLSDIAAQIEKETTDRSTAQNILGKAEAFAETIEGVNDAFENSIRLAAYIGARENGVSRGKAAQLAKNITVNFNKHGEYGQALNAVYLFFNASIQGTMRLGKSLLTMKPPIKPNGVKAEWYERINGAQKMAAGLTVFSAMLATIGRAMSDEDEDGTLFYDKIPDYVKERNLIFMYDGKNHIKVPMPYGFNIFANLGSAAVETAAGAKDPDEAMMFLANSFMGAFSPVSFGQSKDLFTSVGKSATPTVLKPLVEIMTNETYFGGPVYAAQSPYASPKPESSMSFRSPKAIQDFFEWMNETTGGSKHVPGNVDMNPDKFWHIFDYFIGGAGQFVTRTGETAFKVGTKLIVDNDVKVEFNDIPLMRKMYGEPSKYYDFGKFKEREVEINQLLREYKKDRSEDMSRYRNLIPLDNTLKSINKQLKVLRARKREARDIGNYAERSIRIQELMDKERMLIMKFNKIYDKIRNNE